MKIQAPSKTSKNILGPIFLALIALSAIGAILITALYSQTSSLTTLFEVQSYAGKVEVSKDGSVWAAPSPGQALELYSWVKTGPNGEMDMRFGKATFARVKENALFQIQNPQVFAKAAIRVHLEKGTLLVLNRADEIEISTPRALGGKTNEGFFYDLTSIKFVTSSQNATYLVSSNPEKSDYEVSVLRGEVTVRPGIPYKTINLGALESIAGGGLDKKAISEAAWKRGREAYELNPKSAANEAAQIDLAKKSGNFFEYVFDHGTFYQEKWGWCTREFIVPDAVNEPVYLEAGYDVFPKGSWVGIYFKTRNLNMAKFKALKIDARRVSEKAYPEYIRIELKSRYQVVRSFAIKMLRDDWQTVEFPFSFNKETPITEVTMLFSNDKVGDNKSGAAAFKNFVLVPSENGTLPTPPAAQAPAPAV